LRLIDLATHHSGLPRMRGNFRPRKILDPYSDYSVANLYAFLNRYRLPRRVGAKYEYSNLGMGFLGHLLCLRSGLDYEKLVQKRICRPLGMASTGIELDEKMRSRMARGHLQTGIPAPNWNIPDPLAGAGALKSSAADLIRFCRANLSPPSNSLGKAIRKALTPCASRDGKGKVGLSWHFNSSFALHNGGTGGYSSFLAISPKTDTAVVLLANHARPRRGPSLDRFGIDLMKRLSR